MVSNNNPIEAQQEPRNLLNQIQDDSLSCSWLSLFYETIWNVAAFLDAAGEFLIAKGNPIGYGKTPKSINRLLTLVPIYPVKSKAALCSPSKIHLFI